MCMEIKSCFHNALHGFCSRRGYLGKSTTHLVSLDEYDHHLKEKVSFIAITFFTFGIANLVHWLYQYRNLDKNKSIELVESLLDHCIIASRTEFERGEQVWFWAAEAYSEAESYGLSIVLRKKFLPNEIKAELVNLRSVFKLISSQGKPDGYVLMERARHYLEKRNIEHPKDNLVAQISEKYFTELKNELQKLKF